MPKGVKQPNIPAEFHGDEMMDTTGAYLVAFKEGSAAEGISILTKKAGLKFVSSASLEQGEMSTADLEAMDAIHFEHLDTAVVRLSDEAYGEISSMAGEDSSILAVEPERFVYALQGSAVAPAPEFTEEETTTESQRDYVRGYRDGIDHLADHLLLAPPTTEAEQIVAQWVETQCTWGLQATRVPQSRYSGRGIKVALLDTGLDSSNPDFRGRRITAQSFVPGLPPQDGHGHGTHVAGTACGPRIPRRLPRYGIAFESDIFIGKVLDNNGRGMDRYILAGIEWAVTNRCSVVSMSLGAPIDPGQSFSAIYENLARRALAANTLIIAAAGNDSNRPQVIKPVGHPANCPSIMAVGALDMNFGVAYFSNGGLNPRGGQVDIAAPGVNVYSSYKAPQLYARLSGTSMATPHVSGIAALLAQAHPGVSASALWKLLIQTARRLNLPARDAGAGIVQAS